MTHYAYKCRRCNNAVTTEREDIGTAICGICSSSGKPEFDYITEYNEPTNLSVTNFIVMMEFESARLSNEISQLQSRLKVVDFMIATAKEVRHDMIYRE
jgi:hypothetical protein